MPIIESKYNPSGLFKIGHFSTVYSATLRRVNKSKLKIVRERIDLPDADFIDIDWVRAKKHKGKVLISLHGLEGSSRRSYMMGLCEPFNAKGWDVVSVNFRGCSGEINRLYKAYTAGSTDDFSFVIQHVINKYNRVEIALCGISLGGCVVLNYLGSNRSVPGAVIGSVVVSTPLDLYETAGKIESEWANKFYDFYFRLYIYEKMRKKYKRFPDKKEISKLNFFSSMRYVDEKYTAPAHGYENAMDYYKKCSSLQFLPAIKVPTLILNAKNDSFLSEKSYPYKQAKENPFLYLEVSKYGGHVGFYQSKNVYYNESRALTFFEQNLK